MTNADKFVYECGKSYKYHLGITDIRILANGNSKLVPQL
mgnify:CR=1 FL=1